MTDLTGKTALITGASRGIGAAVAKALAGAGAHVVLVARTIGGLEAVDDEIQAAGGSATLMPLDLTKLDDIDQMGPTLLERFGGLDILVGNAGILGPLTPVHQVDPKDWTKVMVTNYAANVRLIRTLDPLLRAAEAGRAVFTHSALADQTLAYWGPYAASKSALAALVQTYAAETKKTNMRINLVNPGIVDTRMLADAFPGGFPGETKKPEEVAETFLGLCSTACETHGEIVSA